jgi:hypothetical protein
MLKVASTQVMKENTPILGKYRPRYLEIKDHKVYILP